MRAIWLVLFAWVASAAQQRSPEMARVTGTDASSGIQFLLLSVEGRAAGPVQPATPPRLTAQCTRNAQGKLGFELLLDGGAGPELRYLAPWRPANGESFPPPIRSVTLTMEYVGYVKEKPVKRQWNELDQLPGEYKYATPSLNSHNLEDVTRCLQYLRSLPMLRVSIPGKPVLEFETAAWQTQLKAAPLCGGSGL